MEGKTGKVMVLGFMLVMGMLAGEASAAFSDCYSHCIDTCDGPLGPTGCPLICLGQCWIDPSSVAKGNSPTTKGTSTEQIPNSQFHFCSVGCTLKACGDSLKDGVKVGNCLKDCSENVCKS